MASVWADFHHSAAAAAAAANINGPPSSQESPTCTRPHPCLPTVTNTYHFCRAACRGGATLAPPRSLPQLPPRSPPRSCYHAISTATRVDGWRRRRPIRTIIIGRHCFGKSPAARHPAVGVHNIFVMQPSRVTQSIRALSHGFLRICSNDRGLPRWSSLIDMSGCDAVRKC